MIGRTIFTTTRRATGLTYHVFSLLIRKARLRLSRRKRLALRFLLIAGIALLTIGDYVIPIIGNIYIPPRSQKPSKLPIGLSLVATRPADQPAAVE